MSRKTCFEITRGYGWKIKLVQTGVDRFTVHYGLQVKADLDYGRAAKELGECLMHALSCEGNVDNREKGEAA